MLFACHWHVSVSYSHSLLFLCQMSSKGHDGSPSSTVKTLSLVDASLSASQHDEMTNRVTKFMANFDCTMKDFTDIKKEVFKQYDENTITSNPKGYLIYKANATPTTCAVSDCKSHQDTKNNTFIEPHISFMSGCIGITPSPHMNHKSFAVQVLNWSMYLCKDHQLTIRRIAERLDKFQLVVELSDS